MHDRTVRNLVYAQLSFFGFLVVAVSITAVGFTDNHGLSFYGVHYPTVVPFGLGFILCDFFLLRAARSLPRTGAPFNRIQTSLRLIAVLILLVLLTPDTISPQFRLAHDTVSLLLFLFELGLAVWLTVRWSGDALTWLLLFAQFFAGCIAMLSQLGFIHYLSHGSLIFQLFFGLLLIWSISKLIDRFKNSVDLALVRA